jgi:hypothetical protein
MLFLKWLSKWIRRRYFKTFREPRNRFQGIDSSSLCSLSPNFLTFKEPKNRFQGINSAGLCSLAGRYNILIPTRFLYCPHRLLYKIPALLFIGAEILIWPFKKFSLQFLGHTGQCGWWINEELRFCAVSVRISTWVRKNLYSLHFLWRIPKIRSHGAKILKQICSSIEQAFFMD